MSSITDRLEVIRQELHLNKSEFSVLLGITSAYYSNILKGNGKGNLRLEHVGNLLSQKGVNPGWIINGEGDKFIQPNQQKNHQETPLSKQSLLDAVMTTSKIRALPGDLSYAILEHLVNQSFKADGPKHTTQELSLAWISMLDFAQHILEQGVAFEFQGKKYGLSSQ